MRVKENSDRNTPTDNQLRIASLINLAGPQEVKGGYKKLKDVQVQHRLKGPH